MVANRTLKNKARMYAEEFGVSYPRALADLTTPGLGVPLHSKTDREVFGFDPRTDRHLILTGTLETRAAVLERVFGWLYYKPGVERFIIDVTGDLAPALSDLAEDGSQGAALNLAAAARVLRNLIHNASNRDSPDYSADQFDVLFINGLPELLQASAECSELLVQLISLASPELSLVLGGDWIGSRPVPGGPQLERATRLHCGTLGELTDFPPRKRDNWLELGPKDGEVIYHRRGFVPQKFGFAVPQPAS